MIRKYLYPKEIFISRVPAEVTTVLGSCISVILFDTEKNIGGINHFMLPSSRNEDKNRNGEYGAYAIPELIRQMLASGSEIRSMKARIFGGASSAGLKDHFMIGQSNSEFAQKCIREAGISILQRDTGGRLPRKIVFYTATGETRIQHIEGLVI
jgi:chemotaxis protein CheD